MINTSESQQRVRMIRQDDPDFSWVDGYIMINRAGFEISDRCPTEYKVMIAEAINHGWLRAVAWVPERQYIWEQLQK